MNYMMNVTSNFSVSSRIWFSCEFDIVLKLIYVNLLKICTNSLYFQNEQYIFQAIASKLNECVTDIPGKYQSADGSNLPECCSFKSQDGFQWE